MKSNRSYPFVALALCFAILMAGPMHPLRAVAAFDLDLNGLTDGDAAAQSPKKTSNSSNAAIGQYQDQISDISSKLNDLKQESQKIQQDIQAAKTEKEQEQVKKSHIDQRISITKDEITLLLERISLLEEDIAHKEFEIEIKKAVMDENYEQFQKRLRTMYMYGDTTALELILGAGSFSDFLTKTETVIRIADHDRALMRGLMEERENLEADKASLEETKFQLEEDREEAQKKKDELATQLYQVNLKIQDMEEMERQFKADLAKNMAEQAAMQREIEEIYRRIEWSKNPYVGGQMAWPVPGYYKITSEYGWRFSGKDYHTGMDISGTGVYGKPIVAANSGTVKLVNWSYTPGRGYGIYLIIDHGGGMSTLYGHCSNIVVQVGDEVERGQKIAEIGSTGWSTGPHLHFEVRVNGQHTNPKQYVIGG